MGCAQIINKSIPEKLWVKIGLKSMVLSEKLFVSEYEIKTDSKNIKGLEKLIEIMNSLDKEGYFAEKDFIFHVTEAKCDYSYF